MFDQKCTMRIWLVGLLVTLCLPFMVLVENFQEEGKTEGYHIKLTHEVLMAEMFS